MGVTDQLAVARTRYQELIQFYSQNVTPETAAVLGTKRINTTVLLQQMLSMTQSPRGEELLLRYFLYFVQGDRPYNQPVIPFPNAHAVVNMLSALGGMPNRTQQEQQLILRRMSEFVKHIVLFLIYPNGQAPTHLARNIPLLTQEARVRPSKNSVGGVWREMAIDVSSPARLRPNLMMTRIDAHGFGQAMDGDGNVFLPNAEDPGNLQAAHIIPRSVCPSQSNDLTEVQKNILNILSMSNPDAVHSLVVGTNVNGLPNMITLTPNLHSLFGALQIWFERQPHIGQHSYRVHSVLPNTTRFPQQVDFRTNNVNAPGMPSEQLLAIHAACVRIARASGAAEAVREMMDKFDEGQVESDGSTPLDTLVAQRIVFGRDCGTGFASDSNLGSMPWSHAR